MVSPRMLEPGDPAPSFVLPAMDRDGTVSLDDFRGRSALLVGFFRGIFCPFCRRQIAQLGASADRLRAEGVEPMGVVITPVGRGRLYFKYHPTKVPLAADETAATHRAFGVPRMEVIDGSAEDAAPMWPYTVTMDQLETVRINPNDELPQPMPPEQAAMALNKADGYQPTDVDGQVMERHWNQLDGLFLIDRNGVVRWRYLEGVPDPTQFGSFPSEDELIEAARLLNN